MESELLIKYKLLEEEYQKLQIELIATKEHLKRYTAPARNKTFYENHKEELLEKMKANPTSSEKRKEYNKTYYSKKKLQELEKVLII
jgi:hypothetical protein